MTAELDLKAIRQIRRTLVKGVQDEKIKASMDWVRYMRNEGVFPEDPKQQVSYTTSTNQGNRYVGASRFWVAMDKSWAKNWKKRFIHVGSDENLTQRIADASEWAFNQVLIRTQSYPDPSLGYPQTGTLLRNVTATVNNRNVDGGMRQAILRSEETPVVHISNYAEYGSTAEARSYYSAQGGIIFYVAKQLQRRYPDLGITFYYDKAQDRGLPHIYDVPTLAVSSPENNFGKWSVPGDRTRRRARAIRRINRRLGRAT